MTISNAQQTKLEALTIPFRSLTERELTLAELRQDALLAESLSLGRTKVVPHWLTDRGLVSELALIGGITMSDTALTALDNAALTSRSIKTLVQRLENDAQGLDWGDPALRAWVASNSIFDDAIKAAILKLAVVPFPVTLDVVTTILGGI